MHIHLLSFPQLLSDPSPCLPPLFLFSNHPPSLICTAHILMDVGLSNGAWSTSQDPHPSRKQTPPFRSHCQRLLSQRPVFVSSFLFHATRGPAGSLSCVFLYMGSAVLRVFVCRSEDKVSYFSQFLFILFLSRMSY